MRIRIIDIHLDSEDWLVLCLLESQARFTLRVPRLIANGDGTFRTPSKQDFLDALHTYEARLQAEERDTVTLEKRRKEWIGLIVDS